MWIRKNISLLIGICIPLVLIIVIAMSIYLPKFFIKPKYNFLYSMGNYYNATIRYKVVNNKLVSEYTPPLSSGSNVRESKLYVYDFDKGYGQEVNYTYAQNYKLDSNMYSKDGFSVSYNTSNVSYFPFFYATQSSHRLYLSGNNVSFELNMPNQIYDYGIDRFEFLGWIEK